jgi:hypothetical protein
MAAIAMWGHGLLDGCLLSMLYRTDTGVLWRKAEIYSL